MSKIKVAIVGLGKIALGYDLADPTGIKTHTKAFVKNPHFELVLGIDPCQDSRNAFEKFANKSSFSSVEEISKELASSIDLVVFATPSLTRVSDCKIYLEFFSNARYVLLEKPLALTLVEAEVLSEVFKSRNLIQNTFVNYMRRCDSHFIELRDRIQKGEWGNVQKIELIYPDTVINMGSHFIDLINFFFDLEFKVVTKKNFQLFENQDFSSEAELESGNVCFKLSPSREKKLEMTFTFKNEVIRIFESGRKIAIGNEVIDVDLSCYQEAVVNHLVQVIQNKMPMLSDFNSAKRALVVCDSIRNF